MYVCSHDSIAIDVCMILMSVETPFWWCCEWCMYDCTNGWSIDRCMYVQMNDISIDVYTNRGMHDKLDVWFY